MTTYAEFRLRIEPGVTPGSYRVEASGLGGEEHGRFKVPFSETELENFVLKVGRTRRGVRRIESPEMEMAKTFGGRLFSGVMDGKVGELYRSAFSEARAAGQGLRLTLSLTDVPELGAIPWEYLYDSPDFLSISTWTPVVRYLDLPKPRRALEVQLPLRILGVVSAPSDAEVLDADAERAKLEDALKPLTAAGAVSIDWLEDANLLALTRKLRPDTYHILHYIGHGGFDDATGEGALLFEDDTGRGRAVSGDQLGTILHDKVALRLVLLNSCEGARNSVSDPFSGVATSLVQREIPAVIGMQFEITDRAAVLFAGEFYSMLAEGQSVDSAITEARLAIFADHNDVEWGTPVLFMRVADGRLFDIASATALPRLDPQELPAKVEPLTVDEAAPLPATVAAAAPVPPTVEEVAPAPPNIDVAAPAPATGSVGAADVAEPAAQQQTLPPTAAPIEVATEPAALDAAATRTASETVAPMVYPTVGAMEQAALQTPAPTAPTAPQRWDVPTRTSQPAARIPLRLVALGVAIVLVLLVGIGLLLAPTSTGSIAVSTADAGSTGRIVVTGKDFAAGENVDISVGSGPSQRAVAGADGSFRAEIPIGSLTSGRVSAVGVTSGRQAGSDFSVTSAAASSGQPASASLAPAASGSQSATGAGLPSDTTNSPGILFYDDVVPGSGTSADYELYLMDPATTTAPIGLTSNDVIDMFPTWSPRHNEIAYTRGVSPHREIVICKPVVETPAPGMCDGAAQRTLTTGHDDYFPAWSKGDQIAFIRNNGKVPSIWVIGSDGSDAHEVLPGTLSNVPPLLRSPAWSPDGGTLVIFGGDSASDYDLILVRPDGTDYERLSGLSTGPNGASDLNPSWSPDGRTIVFVRDDGKTGCDNNELYLLDYATKTVSGPLTTNTLQDGNPVWSPDGNQIAFYRATKSCHERGVGYHLWLMNSDGTNQHDLMPDRDGRNLDPNWR